MGSVDWVGLPFYGVLGTSRRLRRSAEPTTLANRTMIEAFAARAATLRTREPSPLEPERLPKHVRYRCATPRQCSCVDMVLSEARRR